MSTTCSSCCNDCLKAPPSLQSSTGSSPFALDNLLQAGTIALRVASGLGDTACNHVHAEDGQHTFDAQAIIPHLLDAGDVVCCQEWDFLVKQRFISVTYSCADDGQCILRIYLIPYDLEHVQGRLRVRKESVMNPARRYLRSLFPKISREGGEWQSRRKQDFLEDTQDARTLAEIYSDLPSPQVRPQDGSEEIVHRLLNFGDNLEGLGMRTNLYHYQRKSVATMFQRELDQRDVPDPLYIELRTVDMKPFYFQPGTMEVLKQCPMTAPCRGGILCEELGTGKTVMTLALIMATRTQISIPEPSIIDERPIMTPLALRHFPSSEYATARKRQRRVTRGLQHPGVPSLVELLIHHNRTSPNSVVPRNFSSARYFVEADREEMIADLPLGKALKANVPFYHQYLGEPSDRERKQRRKADTRPRTVYLTSATLVVVPPNLIGQWDREITKHCAIPLRVLILRAKTPMPSVQSLANDYDIILMTYTRFTAEHSHSDISKLHTQPACQCPEIEGSRVPNCNCQTAGVTPFLHIRWKRLVIDEGHVSASTSTVLVPFTKLLSVERRWIVTGTPTTNLLGLSLGTKTTDAPLSRISSSSSQGDELPQISSDEDELMEDSHPSTSSTSPNGTPPPSVDEPELPPKRIWNKYDRGDLNKLGNMITHFISVPQFSADPKLISTHVTEPLFDLSGPRRGAIQVLTQVMHSVMIRHRVEDVEKDVVLPPVNREEVLLDMDPFAVKSYNALQAIIAVNAVDSQRTDQDYLFNPRNAEHLQLTLRNMSQLCFWRVDSDLYNAVSLLKDAEKTMQTALERNTPEGDIQLLKDAFFYLQIAMDDPAWVAVQSHEDVPYRIFNMVKPVFQAWTRALINERSASSNQTGFLHADRLLKLYDMILQKPLIQENAMIEWGQAVALRDIAFREAYDESERRKAKGQQGASKKRKDSHGNTTSVGGSSVSLMVDTFAKKASAADTLKEIQRELDTTMARLAVEEGEDDGAEGEGPPAHAKLPTPAHSQCAVLSSLAASSPLATMKIGNSASSKLNYIINEVQKYAATEKFLIFSESPLSLAHIAEALELIHVKFLRFTTQVTPQYREQLVLTFETSETYRVFLMELKHGARGLNLISASRVIFCEPVWQADVESQAIKRAHRIGQTKTINVKTLATRSTAEENMVARRAALSHNREKQPSLIEEAGMRHYIANPKFITQAPTIAPPVNIPFIDLPPLPTSPTSSGIKLRIPARTTPKSALKRVRVEGPIEPPSTSIQFWHEETSRPSKRKATSIRFASPF